MHHSPGTSGSEPVLTDLEAETLNTSQGLDFARKRLRNHPDSPVSKFLVARLENELEALRNQ